MFRFIWLQFSWKWKLPNTKTSGKDRKCIYKSGGCMEIMEEVEEITKAEKSSGDNFVGKR